VKNIRHITILAVILLPCLLMFTFADGAAKAIQAFKSNVRIIYNSKEVSLGAEAFSIGGSDYLSINALAALFDKNIFLNQKEQKIFISDKPDTSAESLKSELAAKNKSIAELQEKVKQLETDINSERRLSINELQNNINKDNAGYEGVSYRVILSGNEDEVRVKIEIDLSWDKASWGSMNTSEKKEMIKEICNPVLGEYGYVRINGYIKDISGSRKLITFYNTYEGEIVIGTYKSYSIISALEESFNDNYDDYFKGIHFTYGLKGNENRVEYTIFIQGNKFEEKWNKLADNNIRGFMKRLCSEIQKNELKKCHITGYVYNTDSGSYRASCELAPNGDFYFERE